jgi:hypothetical protein
MKNAVFWDVTPVALVRTDVLEERSASIIRVTLIGELGTTLAVSSNRLTLRKNTKFFLRSVHRLLVAASRGLLQMAVMVPSALNNSRRKVLETIRGPQTTQTPWPLVSNRTIPTDQLPLVGEVIANFCG